MLSTGFCHVWAVIHNKHCFMRFRKNLHFVFTFVPGPAVNERRLREKAGEGGWGVGAQSACYHPQKTDCRAHLPTLQLLKRGSARMRVHAQERTRARACARSSRTAPPSSLPLRSHRRPNRNRAEKVRWGGRTFNDCSQSTVGKDGQEDLREPPKVLST